MRLFQFSSATLPSLWALVQPADHVLLRQDAVYLLLTTQQWPCQVFVLQPDLMARGLVCPPTVNVISDTQWVELTLQASQVISCPD